MLAMHYISLHQKNEETMPQHSSQKIVSSFMFSYNEAASQRYCEDCLQALQSSHKDMGNSVAWNLLQQNWHCLTLFFKRQCICHKGGKKTPKLKQKQNQNLIQIYLAYTIMYTSSYSRSIRWRKINFKFLLPA